MKLTGYATAQEARTALKEAGYALAYSPPGCPRRWELGDKVRAVAKKKVQRKGEGWRIVPYPEELEERIREELDL